MAKNRRTAVRTSKKDWTAKFLLELSQSGNVFRATKKAQVARSTVYLHRESDPAFAAAWAEAEAVAVEVMEAEAHRRAVEGTNRPVFQGGRRIGLIREYSDTLLIFLLKARRPGVYRDNARVVVAGDPHNPVKHDHGNVLDRIDQLAAAFAGAANREEESTLPVDSAGQPVSAG